MASSEQAAQSTDLTRHRSEIARTLLIGFAGLGLVAYVPSVWLALRVGEPAIAIFDTAIYAALLAVLAFGGDRYWLKAGTVVGACYVVGAVMGALLGPVGAGPIWFTVTPIAAGILFSRRSALYVLGLVAVSTAALTALELTGVVSWGEPVSSAVLWVVLSSNALLVAGALTLAVSTLIARLEREMAERRRAEEQLRQADKLQAVGTLAAGIAHDFNNLLTPILTAAELARSETDEHSEQRAVQDGAVKAAVAGRDLVRRILAFSRPSGEGRTTLPASEAFRDAIRLLRAAVPGSVAVDLSVREDGFLTLAPSEVHQVVLNLGTNAQKAMPEGGQLWFRLNTLPGDEVAWSAPSVRPEHVVRLEVTDSGHGMSPEVARRIFEPFYTTDPHQGTGMGLSTVHGIVASAGGQIACRSRPGEGTTFTVDFPAAPAPTPVAPTPVEPEPLSSAGRHVLVVDDEQPVRDVATRVLRRQGYRVTPLPGARAALDLLQRPDHDTDLVLSDLNMPGMSGLQLAERVRLEHPGVRVLLMSGLVDEHLQELADEVGVERCIAKPFRLQELLQAVRASLQRDEAGISGR